MKPSRIVLAAAAAVTLVTSLVTAGTAADAASTNAYSKRVCAHAATGYVACDARVRTDANLKPLATTTWGGRGYSPAQLQTAYGLNGGAAPLVAVVDAYAHPSPLADLNAYRAQFGLGSADQLFTQVNQNGQTGPLAAGNTGWGQEEMLDLEMVSAICPACHILYVGANSASFADLATAVNTAFVKGAKVISNSYGGNEFSSEGTLASAYDHPGVAITVSSGDSGYGAQAPAAFKTVVAVGGTHLVLDSNGNRTGESVWSGAGSGCSAYIAKPDWQHDAGCARRTISDVSAVADPATGVAVYDSYGSTGGANWYVFGGTSVAAPIIGGVYALSGVTTGYPASLAYSASAGSLFDVTSGSNGRCVRGKTGYPYLCTGVTGYDGPSGMGTPIGTSAF